jgi:hypothetical protein
MALMVPGEDTREAVSRMQNVAQRISQLLDVLPHAEQRDVTHR